MLSIASVRGRILLQGEFKGEQSSVFYWDLNEHSDLGPHLFCFVNELQRESSEKKNGIFSRKNRGEIMNGELNSGGNACLLIPSSLPQCSLLGDCILLCFLSTTTFLQCFFTSGLVTMLCGSHTFLIASHYPPFKYSHTYAFHLLNVQFQAFACGLIFGFIGCMIILKCKELG